MKTKPGARVPSATSEVDAFMANLKHPLKAEIEAVRRAILAAAPGIDEAVKWNAPSFRTTEFFATFHLRSATQVQLIFHLGAKKRVAPKEMKVADPTGLAKWLAPDRCLLALGEGAAVNAKLPALRAFVATWIRHV